MRVLIIKMSSMGDIIHTFPALTDAIRTYPDIEIDWVVEENFVPVAALHPSIKNIIPIALRRWRKTPFKASTLKEFIGFIKTLRSQRYDLIIDVQGLLKSSIVSYIARGPSWGLNYANAREKLAGFFYTHRVSIPTKIDALTRTRHIFASALNYKIPQTLPESGLTQLQSSANAPILFLPGTTWENKKWPVSFWYELAKIINSNDLEIHVPWSNQKELLITKQIQQAGSHVTIMEPMNLTQLCDKISDFRAVVSVDTGLGYLAAALNIPTIMLFGPTNPEFIGSFPNSQINITSTLGCAPCLSRKCTNPQPSPIKPVCFIEITPEIVWQRLAKSIGLSKD